MLISKTNLYKPEWLELVFDNRNKAYGAYELRQHYAKTMIMAMVLTFLTIGGFCGVVTILSNHHRAKFVPDQTKTTIVTLTNITTPVVPPKPVTPPKPIDPPKTTAFVPMVVKPDVQVVTPPPIVTEITGAIGQTNTAGKDGPQVIDIDNTPGTGKVPAPPAPDNSVHDMNGLEVMPSPIGGQAAWAKFLNKNLRYPNEAQEEGASGRVYMSFIIEKDGTFSNVTVERAAGHGFDEEAARVLKLAKAWKPGVQNGQPVRVKFIIPINFSLGDQQ